MKAYRTDCGPNRGKEEVGWIERVALTYTPCVKWWWEAARPDLSSVLCDELEGWDGRWLGGKSKREGIDVYI